MADNLALLVAHGLTWEHPDHDGCIPLYAKREDLPEAYTQGEGLAS
jgi:hypothetical protein